MPWLRDATMRTMQPATPREGMHAGAPCDTAHALAMAKMSMARYMHAHPVRLPTGLGLRKAGVLGDRFHVGLAFAFLALALPGLPPAVSCC